jgi:ATP-dependent helicase/nuclease subunit A
MSQPLGDQGDRDLIMNALDDTLIVEAAAGTGKTTELVRRMISVIKTGRAEVTEIVSVTFTEKAAGELKLRLREALEESRGAAAAGSDERDRLDRALQQLEEAQVSTIHGFCADLLRERPVEARVDPLFTVLTEAQGRKLYDSAFQTWLEEQLADPPEGIQRSLRRPSFGGFGPGADNEDGPVERLRSAGWELIQWRDFEGDWQRPPFDRAGRIDALVARLVEFAELSDKPANPHDNLYVDTRPARQLSEEIRRTETVVFRDDNRLEAALIELGRNQQFQRARKGNGRTYRANVLREDVTRAREQLQTELSRFETDANADLAALLHQELRPCARKYEEAKAQAGALDFLDLLLRARNLIKHDGDVRSSFQRRFKRLFVDEFQDTDPLQAEILLLLAADDPSTANWRNVHPIPGKLFIVGDPKQSIYRFRRADVGIYRGVYDMLERAGAKRVTLRASFRARLNIQRAINASFEPVMTGEHYPRQARYVRLEPFRDDLPEQPSVVVLPVPEPYGTQRIANISIEESLPKAVGAFVEWLVHESHWMVAERSSSAGAAAGSDLLPAVALGFKPGEKERLVPVQPRHICLLFRRFVSYGEDMTRPYVQALEARGVPHLLVGGRSFHNRGEIETLRAALAAIEWPDDELSVFATLRGALFAIGDEELVEYRHRFSHFHPFRIPKEASPGCASTIEALQLLQSLHRSRNHVPVATTISTLLEATRAHVRFALEHGGEQVLANVLHVAELARQYETEGGISFRGFIDELRERADGGEAGEAPILEEGSDGVRLMTVHKAKGLEFPVVVLADMTARIRTAAASRYLDSDRGTCAIRLAGCSPFDLIQHQAEELQCDEAEGVRLAYVAATRARDLLVVPAVGDEEREGWIEPLNRVIYPPAEARRQQVCAPGCPEFRSKDSVLTRPNGDPASPNTVCPGLHVRKAGSDGLPETAVVWWDPRELKLDADPPLGIRSSQLIVRDVAPEVVEAGLADYSSWRAGKERTIAAGSQPSVAVQTVTRWAKSETGEMELPPVEVVEVPREENRPSGRRFGALVHTVLGTVPLDGDADVIRSLAEAHGRTLGATDEEVACAERVVQTVLAQPILQRARDAMKENRCRREVPVTWREPAGGLLEGVIDLAFREGNQWIIVDFKTDEEFRRTANYGRQVRLYSAAVRAATGQMTAGILMRI